MKVRPVILIVLVLIFVSGFMIGLLQKPWKNHSGEVSSAMTEYTETSGKVTMENLDNPLFSDTNSLSHESLSDTALVESLTVLEDTNIQETAISESNMEIPEEVELYIVETIPETDDSTFSNTESTITGTSPVSSETLYLPIVDDTLERF